MTFVFLAVSCHYFFVVEEDEVFEIAFDVSTYETSKRFINQINNNKMLLEFGSK